MCDAAKKEEAVEKKLGRLAERWKEQNLTFCAYKSRGLLVLKVAFY